MLEHTAAKGENGTHGNRWLGLISRHEPTPGIGFRFLTQDYQGMIVEDLGKSRGVKAVQLFSVQFEPQDDESWPTYC